MERIKKWRFKYIVLTAVAAALFCTLAEGCRSERKCGCGHDLNGIYKSRRHR